jgi:hypothetical protein
VRATPTAADVYDPKWVRASTGSLFGLPVVRVPTHQAVLAWVSDVRARQKAVNRAHAKIRARGERAIATLRTWEILTSCAVALAGRSRSCGPPLVLHHVESQRYAG